MTASVAVLGLGVGASLPLTALALTARGLGPQIVGWMAAATAAGGIASTLVAPALTLRFGRRAVMLMSVAVAAASVVCLQYVDALWGWAALRAAFGASMAPLFIIGEAWITSLPADAVRGRVVAIYSTSFTVCQLLGPLLTDAMADFPAQAFLICGAVFLLGAPGIALARDASGAVEPSAATPPATVGSAPAPAKDSLASWFTIVRKAPAIIAGTAFFAAFDTVMLNFLPVFAQGRGLTRTRALLAVVVVLSGDATLQFAAGWFADRFGHARVHRAGGLALCILLPLLPWMLPVAGWWELYLFVLGGIAGSVYTLSMVSSGERFSGAALLRVSSLIALTWSLSSSIGPAATGILMQHWGGAAVTSVLFVMALAFVLATRLERSAAERAVAVAVVVTGAATDVPTDGP